VNGVATDGRSIPAARQEDEKAPARRGHGSHPFRVPVSALRRRVGSTRHVVAEGRLAGLGALGVSVPDGALVRVDLDLCSDPGGVTASGTVSSEWVGECRRCGGAVEGRVRAAVRERFVPEDAAREDEEAYPLVDDVIDLEPLVRDAVLLELPLAPLCDEACLGLCPLCGTNWNESPCDCRPAADPRWSVLDSLRDPPG
jgi:DUF177 domain-containing protein